jgi:hypothetical protein
MNRRRPDALVVVVVPNDSLAVSFGRAISALAQAVVGRATTAASERERTWG